jgi:hypothetical protein
MAREVKVRRDLDIMLGVPEDEVLREFATEGAV